MILGRSKSWRSKVDGVGPIIGVDGLELAILKHSFEYARVEQLCFLNDALDHLFGGGLELSLDEADDSNVAPDLDIFAEVEAIRGYAELRHADLERLWRLHSRLVSSDAILVPQLNAHWSVDMCL